MITAITFIISLTSGVVGGRLGKKWDELTEEKVITARGKSAVRDLKVLLGSVNSLETRVREYLRHIDSVKKKTKNDSHEVTKLHLEEVIRHCGLLEVQVINSTENWTDIVPEANVSTQIGDILNLKDTINSLGKDVEALNSELSELAETKGKNQEEIARLMKEKHEKEKELLEVREKLREKALSFGPTITTISGLSNENVFSFPETGELNWAKLGSTGVNISPFRITNTRTCSQCGKSFVPDTSGGIQPITIDIQADLCPDCKKKAASSGK